MKKRLLSWQLILGGLLLTVLSTGCLKNEAEEKEDQEKQKIKAYLSAHGLDESNNIGYGIYLKITNKDTNLTTGARPQTNQTIVVTFTGKYTDGTLFECTDSALGVKTFPDRYIVYGPHRVKTGYLVSGIDYAIRKFQVGDTGLIVVPSEYAFYDYEPVVYTVTLNEIIENDSVKEQSMLETYKVDNGFNENDTALFDNVLYKGHPAESSSVEDGDSVTVKIIGRYAEDYYANNLGRIFFPLYNAKEQIKWQYGNEDAFPISEAIEKTLTFMHVGDTMEILSPSSSAYGSNGFYNPYLYIAIVPGYMPVHYRLILVEVEKPEE